MTIITIRPAILADAAAITAVHCSTVGEWRDPTTRQPADYATLDLFGRWYNGGPWMSAEMCAIHLNALLLRGHLPLVAEVGGNIVGEAEFYIHPEPPPFGPYLHLSVLYVHKGWQRHGIGRALVEAGVDYACARKLTALTPQPEAEATGFYQRVGFRPWLRAQEMQIATHGAPPPLVRLHYDNGPPTHLALRIGRYQCGVQNWESLWPSLMLPELLDLRRNAWAGELSGSPVVVGLRGQFRNPTQADGYAWLLPSAPLVPAINALRALGALERYSAIDLLLPEDAVPELKATFRLDYQATVTLWRRDIL